MNDHDHHNEHGHAEHAEHAEHAGHHVHFDTPAMAADAELEGEVLSGFVTQAASAVAGLADQRGLEVRRVLDIGCGPGVGACHLAERFDTSRVVAADGSAAMLERVQARAERLGLADRVEGRRVELPDGLATLGRADVAWVSMALHHVGDEASALVGIRELLEPGGLLALIEFAGPVRTLPTDVDLGRPGIWDRLDAAWAAWFEAMRADVPGATTSDAYPAMLDAAGFDLVADEVLTLVLDAPLDAPARRFAQRQVQRARAQLEGRADTADLAAIDLLLDEDADEGILHRADARISASRHLYIARARVLDGA